MVTDHTAAPGVDSDGHTEHRKARRLPNALPTLAFSVDLDWLFRSHGDGVLPGSGRLARELDGRDVREIWHDHPEVIDAIGRALNGERASGLVHAEGVVFESHYVPLHNDAGELVGASGFCLDVTEREQALRKVRDHEARFRAFTQSSSELVALQDRHGRFLWVNELHEQMFGISAAELVGESSLSRVHPEDREELAQRLREIPQEGSSERFSFRVLDRDRKVVWLNSTARAYIDGDGVRRLLTVSHDVTSQIELQQRLERQAKSELHVSELSRRLISLQPEDMGEAIRDSMGEVARLSGADHMTLLVVGQRNGDIERLDWPDQAPSDPPHGSSADDIGRSSHAMAILNEGRPLCIPNLDALPPEADSEREDMTHRGVKSSLSIPLEFQGRQLGFQFFETYGEERTWGEEEITLLTLLGEVLARAVERHHTQANLMASEEKFRALSENMTDIVLEIDQAGNLVWASPSFGDTLGHQPEAIFGRNMASLIHPEDLRETRHELGHALRELDARHSTYRVRHADGRWIWLETRGRGYRTSSGDVHYVGHTRDITEQRQLIDAFERRHRADREIARLSSRFLQLSTDELDEGLSDGIQSLVEIAAADRAYLMDITRWPRLVVPSQAWTQADIDRAVGDEESSPVSRFGWVVERLSRGEVLEISDSAALTGDAAELGRDLVERGVQSLLGIPMLSDGRLLGYLAIEYLSGCREWNDREMSEIQILAEIFAGALQRGRAERALAEQLEFERRISELSQQFLGVSSEGLEFAIHEALAATGDLAEVDRAFLLSFPLDPSGAPNAGAVESFQWCSPGVEMTKMEPTESKLGWALGRNPIEIPRVDRLPDEYRELRERLERRGVQSFLGLPIQTQSGHAGFLGLETHTRARRWGEQRLSMLRLLAELFGSALRRLHAERALRASQQQLMHAQKMEAVGRLAGGIAHDFNNLLTVILGFSDSLVSDLESGSELREDAEAIADAAERAAALTSQLLTFSRRQSSLSRTSDLGKITMGLRGLLERLLGADFELVFESPDEPCWALVDPAQIEQVLVNLVVNARDAMLEGGRIVVRLRTCRLDASELVRFGLPAAGRFHLLEIEDHGSGIEPQLMEHIFEPFYTTKAPGKGTGLGLSIVYSVVREHRGGVVVESTPGAGALFSLAFPACDEATSEEPRRVEDARGAGEETILLVEDEPSVRRLLLRTFERAGYRVIEAANGERALALLATKGPSWMDLLVTDIVMPGINGGELARRVRELDPEMPVLYVSGHPQDRGPSEADPNLPAGRYLTKPFQKNRLLSEVRLALDGE